MLMMMVGASLLSSEAVEKSVQDDVGVGCNIVGVVSSRTNK